MSTTYYEIMTTDLGWLTTAATQWEAMAGELGKVETRYRDSVQKISMGPSWAGVSAGVAQTNFAAPRYEYSAAQIQAKAVASLLRDAHEKFTDLRTKLESARDDAIAAGMTVSEQGHVAFDRARLTPSERSAYDHRPDGEALSPALGGAVGLEFTVDPDKVGKSVADAADAVGGFVGDGADALGDTAGSVRNTVGSWLS